MYRCFFKGLLDFLAAFFLIVVFSPILILVVVLLLFSNLGSIFFLQERPGKGERIFKVIKFKTMNDKKDTNGELLPDANRLTKVGKFIRKTSLDELPQLINVLKGDMSLIGPRPLLPEYLSLYNSEQKKRHNVKPGITGWAQVNGRNAISWAKKFEYDVWYVDHLSFLLDLKIIIKTIINVLKSKDINTKNQATTVKFTGNN
ncbi:sugar transferase [Aestuariivivens marinum]|uniref:sugar transferase n=1 Tax=Aestuariivivens marinum TaxID=2913555 RepID=UPI001F582C44|nr:sugar transferase [Aestuariivivens marinum]